AWEVLRDPARRASFDLARRLERRNAERQADQPVRPPASSAETTSTTRPTPPPSAARPPETVSSDWSSGRSTHVSGYGPWRMPAAVGFAAAGLPPGAPSGPVLTFGRYAGWSLGEIARRDLEYVEWLDRMPIGRPFRDEIDQLLRKAGRRRSATPG